ncbi:MAG: thioredoxin family protein [Bdellovibrionota bacterium]
MIKLSALLLSLFMATVSFAAKVGEKAPDFKVSDMNGKTVQLADFKGKFVVLEWMNEGCPFVKKHYESNNMQKLQKEYTGKNVAWLTVASSQKGKQGHWTPEQAQTKAKEWNMAPTAILLDEGAKMGKAYGAKVTPHMFVINPEGVLVYNGAIDDNDSSDAADIPKSTNYVDLALKESLAGKPVKVSTSKPYGCGVKF